MGGKTEKESEKLLSFLDFNVPSTALGHLGTNSIFKILLYNNLSHVLSYSVQAS